MILMLLMQDGFRSDIHIIERIHTPLLWFAPLVRSAQLTKC